MEFIPNSLKFPIQQIAGQCLGLSHKLSYSPKGSLSIAFRARRPGSCQNHVRCLHKKILGDW